MSQSMACKTKNCTGTVHYKHTPVPGMAGAQRVDIEAGKTVRVYLDCDGPEGPHGAFYEVKADG